MYDKFPHTQVFHLKLPNPAVDLSCVEAMQFVLSAFDQPLHTVAEIRRGCSEHHQQHSSGGISSHNGDLLEAKRDTPSVRFGFFDIFFPTIARKRFPSSFPGGYQYTLKGEKKTPTHERWAEPSDAERRPEFSAHTFLICHALIARGTTIKYLRSRWVKRSIFVVNSARFGTEKYITKWSQSVLPSPAPLPPSGNLCRI